MEVLEDVVLKLTVNFLEILKSLWTRVDLLVLFRLLHVYLSADSVEIETRIRQGTGLRFEASGRRRSSSFTVKVVQQI